MRQIHPAASGMGPEAPADQHSRRQLIIQHVMPPLDAAYLLAALRSLEHPPLPGAAHDRKMLDRAADRDQFALRFAEPQPHVAQ